MERLNDPHRALFGRKAFSTLARLYLDALGVDLNDAPAGCRGTAEGTLSSSSLEHRSAEEKSKLPGLPVFPAWREDSRT